MNASLVYICISCNSTYHIIVRAWSRLLLELVSRERPAEAGRPALDRRPAHFDRLLPDEGAGAGEPAARRVGRQGVRACVGALDLPFPVRELRRDLQQGVPGQGQARPWRHLPRRALARPASRRRHGRAISPESRVLASARRTSHFGHRGGQEHLLALSQPVCFTFCNAMLV